MPRVALTAGYAFTAIVVLLVVRVTTPWPVVPVRLGDGLVQSLHLYCNGLQLLQRGMEARRLEERSQAVWFH